MIVVAKLAGDYGDYLLGKLGLFCLCTASCLHSHGHRVFVESMQVG